MVFEKIVSDLTIQFSINYNTDNNNRFPDFDCWEILYVIIGNELGEDENDEAYTCTHPFDLDKEGCKKIRRAIPYMLIEKVHVYPCCVKFDNQFFL